MSNLQIAHAEAPSVQDFRKRYVRTGTPVILTGLLDDWPAFQRWSPEYLCEKYGHENVTVEELGFEQMPNAESFFDQERRQLKLADYINQTTGSDAQTGLYLAQHPLFAEARHDLRRLPYIPRIPTRIIMRIWPMVWVGPKGCSSALHFDYAHNFVMQFRGVKRWTIFAPDQKSFLYLPSTLKMTNFSPINLAEPDLKKFPRFAEATPIEFDLRPGEVLYLPPDWPHFVRSMEYCVTVNDWWTPWGLALTLTRHKIWFKLRKLRRRS